MTNYATIGYSLREPPEDREAVGKASLVEALVMGVTGANESYVRDEYEDELCARIGQLEVYMAALAAGSRVAHEGLQEVRTDAARAAVERAWPAYCQHCEALSVEEPEGPW